MNQSLARSIFWIGSINRQNYTSTVEKLLALYKEKEDEEITLFITSAGGDIELALAFHDLVGIIKPHLTTVALGKIHSSALVLLMAGNTRFVTRHTLTCFHRASVKNFTAEDVSVETLQSNAHHLELLDKEIAHIITRATKSKVTAAQLADLDKREAVLDYKQLIELGLVNDVMKT